MNEIIRKKITVKGIVQGVGFRPFVFRLASQYSLSGKVFNNPQGVIIEVEGDHSSIQTFLKALQEGSPPLSEITDIHTEDLEILRSSLFKIVESKDREEKKTLISPDIAVCADCLAELFDPKDRRYRYPFINCTNCGPRFTIIRKIPYDRVNTSMSVFKMCPACQKEYDEPSNRRFHAQPNACFECGPEAWLSDSNGKKIETDDPIKEAASLLKEGKILAIKGLGGFHLAVDAVNARAVRRLRQRKFREEKPLAIMSESLERIREYASFTNEEKELLSSPRCPIVLLEKKDRSNISEDVAPKNTHLGVMLPYTPIHHLLFRSNIDITALVMTSGNLSEEPIVIENEEALTRLAGIADYFLMHNRDILLRSDDSVTLQVSEKKQSIRRSRGFVPVPVFLKEEYPPVLACGAELKNTVCVLKDNNAFLSQHVGDLENMDAFNFFLEASEHLKNILEVSPVAMAYDLHPEYLNTKFAKEQKNITLVGIQHHHAHIASCLAENGEGGPVIGLSMDGLGYGTDGMIWGGEFLYADFYGFERMASFKNIPMPGGTAAIKEPWRMAVSYLYDAYGETMSELNIPFIKGLGRFSLAMLVRMIQLNLNSPLTSSLGRIFDAVSAILQIRSEVHFEGQAAFELEMAIDPASTEAPPYSYFILETDKSSKLDRMIQLSRDDQDLDNPAPLGIDFPTYLVDMKETFKGMVADVMAGKTAGEISSRFHNTVISIMIDLCSMMRRELELEQVALSGGVFQNKYLFKNLVSQLEQKGFEVLTHSKVPTNDGGLSLGQAVIAGSLLKKQKLQVI
jgi:hydrogenase maturation protein HypF